MGIIALHGNGITIFIYSMKPSIIIGPCTIVIEIGVGGKFFSVGTCGIISTILTFFDYDGVTIAIAVFYVRKGVAIALHP